MRFRTGSSFTIQFSSGHWSPDGTPWGHLSLACIWLLQPTSCFARNSIERGLELLLSCSSLKFCHFFSDGSISKPFNPLPCSRALKRFLWKLLHRVKDKPFLTCSFNRRKRGTRGATGSNLLLCSRQPLPGWGCSLGLSGRLWLRGKPYPSLGHSLPCPRAAGEHWWRVEGKACTPGVGSGQHSGGKRPLVTKGM